MSEKVTWKDICHKCGHKIYNGFQDGCNFEEVKNEMTKAGYRIGYNDNCKPICSECSSKEYQKIGDKKVNKNIAKIVPKLVKVYVCPLCTGYLENVYKSTNKKEIVNHMKYAHWTELKN